jgi:TetR/AcrR family transcriptional regulator, transcriptional repressor for nem operon
MARIVKEEERAARRNEIINAAQRLIFTKGYEQTSIQNVLDELDISKGAFYHYFDSKQALLEAIILSMSQEAIQLITPIVRDPNLTALEKFKQYFDIGARWKTARKGFFLSLIEVWYRDDNALMRQRLFATLVELSGPLFTEIIRQGVREKVFTTAYPDQIAVVILVLFQGLSDSIIEFFLSQALNDEILWRTEKTIAVYLDAIERVLGAPSHSLKLVDLNMLKEWVDAPAENVAQEIALKPEEQVAVE